MQRNHSLHFTRNRLFCNGTKWNQFEVKPLIYKQNDVTLNQRVPGSSPGAPTKPFKIKDLQGVPEGLSEGRAGGHAGGIRSLNSKFSGAVNKPYWLASFIISDTSDLRSHLCGGVCLAFGYYALRWMLD